MHNIEAYWRCDLVKNGFGILLLDVPFDTCSRNSQLSILTTPATSLQVFPTKHILCLGKESRDKSQCPRFRVVLTTSSPISLRHLVHAPWSSCILRILDSIIVLTEQSLRFTSTSTGNFK